MEAHEAHPHEPNQIRAANRAETIISSPPQRLRPHPQAAIVPALDPAGFELLRADIAERGLQTPLEATEAGLLLDGRARLRAAVELGLERVPVRLVAPTDEREHMLLCALRRRQLTPSQQAALARSNSRLSARWPCRRRRGSGRTCAGRSRWQRCHLGGRGRVSWPPANAGVSARTVQDAATVQAADPELFEQVKAGVVPAHAAARRVRRRRRHEQISPPPPLPQGPFELALRRGASQTRTAKWVNQVGSRAT